MEIKDFIDILHIAERLKDETRHAYTSKRRKESVAEHSWRLALMAYLLEEEFKDYDIYKVIKMCLIHDLGEAFTGDIAAFNKSEKDEELEALALKQWISKLPLEIANKFKSLYQEMHEMKSKEAKLYKALDALEAVIQHNESPLDTWEKIEYELNLTYGNDRVAFSPFLKKLREQLYLDSLEKINSKDE